MLNQDSSTPLYVQLMDEIELAITSGVYKPGEKIMTEAEMAQKYGISLITVRKAIGSLMEKGLVIRKQGKGTFVTRPKLARNMKKLQSFTEMCRQMGAEPGGKLLESRLVEADERTAERLNITPGSKVVYISRLRLANQEPVQIERSYFPIKYAFLLDSDLDDQSLFQVLREKSGMQVVSSQKVIELCRATAEEAALLGIHKTDYLLFVRSTAYDQNDEPLYTGIQIINGDRFALYVYENNRE